MIRALIDDTANGLGIERILDPVEHDLGDRQLAKLGFRPRLKINRLGKAVFLGKADAAKLWMLEPICFRSAWCSTK